MWQVFFYYFKILLFSLENYKLKSFIILDIWRMTYYCLRNNCLYFSHMVTWITTMKFHVYLPGKFWKRWNLSFLFIKYKFEKRLYEFEPKFHWLPVNLRKLHNLFATLILYITNIIVLASQSFCKHNIITHKIGNDLKQSVTHCYWDYKLIQPLWLAIVNETLGASIFLLSNPTSKNIPWRWTSQNRKMHMHKVSRYSIIYHLRYCKLTKHSSIADALTMLYTSHVYNIIRL